MTLSVLYSRANVGMDAPSVAVEAHVSGGLPRFHIVGLPEAAVKESRDRVRSALLNSGLDFPARRITINLAPADLPKEGGRFDLPIALGILAATGQIPEASLLPFEFVGELALSGELRPIRGILPVVLAAQKQGRSLIVPHANAAEAGLVNRANVYSAANLLEVCCFLRKQTSLPHCESVKKDKKRETSLDLQDVRGQPHAKRALEVAASGQHNILFIGPPGTGKTMLANRLPSILPDLTDDQALDVAAIASVGKAFDHAKWLELPFRSPHHSSSSIALVGGGRPPKPGEISLAHHGVLFLDELPEFNRDVLESLREPLESGSVTISRAAYQTTFPAQFQFIAAMNPCPCGFVGSTVRECRCASSQIERYLGKLSGPLLDRIDMQVEVASLSPDVLNKLPENNEDSERIKQRVLSARAIQYQRQGKLNRDLKVKEIDDYCPLRKESREILDKATERFSLSPRMYHRLIKIARSIADLGNNDFIETEHIAEALSYRCLDRIKNSIYQVRG